MQRSQDLRLATNAIVGDRRKPPPRTGANGFARADRRAVIKPRDSSIFRNPVVQTGLPPDTSSVSRMTGHARTVAVTVRGNSEREDPAIRSRAPTGSADDSSALVGTATTTPCESAWARVDHDE